MRRLLMSCFALALISLNAQAGPVALRDLVRELGARGAENIDYALILNEPLVTFQLDEQSVKLKASQCDGEAYACKILVFSTCRQLPALPTQTSAALANDYNAAEDGRGVAYLAMEPTLGQKLCVRLRMDLHEEDRFDLADVFDWQLTMRDFLAYLDDEIDRIEVKTLLGVSQ